ncbi:MAG: hypothetical protein DCF20_12890 [Pseudanabaena sp.]|nr:MAG: hypothetical protein DCF20_12890 [Pseudanabaena sp.]
MHMASTSKKNRATSSGKSEKSSSMRSPKSQPVPNSNKPKGSMGLGLLLIAIGTSLIGLGGLGYFVYQELLSSSRREVDISAESQTRKIEAKLANVQQTVDGAARGAKILLQQQPKPRGSAPFQRLLVESLQSDDSIAGMGIASSGNLLFPPAKPLVPYVWNEQSGLTPETPGQKLDVPNDKLLAGDRSDIQKAPFYQDTLKGQASWSQIYTALGKTIITYSAPISDGQKIVGIVNADVIAGQFLSLVDTATYPDSANESKIGLVVASSSGKVISASNQFQSLQSKNPAIGEALTSLAQQAKTQPSGIIQTGGNLWAYRKIPSSGLLVAAQLPESEITNRLIILVGGTAVGISAILAIAILGFVNSLKKRLKPLTEECDRFLRQQGNSGSNVAGKDEIDQLGLTLKNTFQQVKNNEIRLRGQLNQSSTSGDDISTAAQIQLNFAETELMEAEVGNLLEVVSLMEEGDLTIEAQVNDRATGLVADTLNRLREKLVEIISSVLGTAQQVAQGAADLEELARTVVLNTAEQAQSVAQGQALTEQVATIAERSATQVSVANQSLQEVRDTVTSGQTAINTLTDSISVLQTGSAQIVQRMKTLGEFVGLAEQFVQDQGQIASLTQVLALNATLVAARAAEQKDPKQFTSVAREFESIALQVNDLATQTNDGLTVLQQRTSQIQTVVTAIDVEVQNLSGLVAGFTEGVESSQSAFNSIQIATEEVVQIGQTITESSSEIAGAAGSTASYISEISQLADRTADLTRSARQQAEAMGDQAQQLLQGIQFFRLPDSSKPLANEISSGIELDSSDTNVNTLLESSTESGNSETNSNLGLVVPAIAVVTAVTAVGLSQSKDIPTDSATLNEEDNTATDNRYLEDLLDDHIGGVASEENAAESLQGQNFAAVSQNVVSEEVIDNENQAPASYSDLTDISIIEEALLADLKQEIYNDNSDEEFLIEDNSDTAPTLKNPIEGVNEFAIVEAASDPFIVSATSSFLEDTAFGTVTPLDEDSNLNLSPFVDFKIPDLDDEDFVIPKMNIESTLDDSNSFFDSNTSKQEIEVNRFSSDFDPFAADDLTIIQETVESHEESIGNEIPLELNSLDASIGEIHTEDISENFVAHESEDYSEFTSNNAINEALEESLQSPSNEFIGDGFDTSFADSVFESNLDESPNISLDEPISFVESTFESAHPDTTTGDEFELDQSDIYSDNLENPSGLSELPTQIPDIYLDASSDDEFLEEFTFDIDENPLTKDTDAVEPHNFFDLTINKGNEEFGEEIVEDFEDQVSDSVDLAIAPELEIMSPPMDLSDLPSVDFAFETSESLSMESLDLFGLDDTSEGSADGLLDATSIEDSNEFATDPFDLSINIPDNDSLMQETQHLESFSIDLSDEESEDVSALFNVSDDDAETLGDQFELEQNTIDNQVGDSDDLDSIWQTEDVESDPMDISNFPSVDFFFDSNESLSMESAGLIESDNFLESSSDELLDADSAEDSEEFVTDPFDVSTSPQDDDSLDLSDAKSEDISALFNVIDDDSAENLGDQLEIEHNITNSLSEEHNELDSVWQTEETTADESNFFATFEVNPISDSENLADPFESQDNVQDEIDDAFGEEIEILTPSHGIEDSRVSTLTDSELETAFPSLIDEIENVELQSSEVIWETEDVSPAFVESSEVREELPEIPTSDVTDSPSETFALSDLSLMEETGDALFDEGFTFELSNDDADYDALSSYLDEEAPIDFAEGLLSDSEADVSSIFIDNLEQESELSYQEFINNSEIILDTDENSSTFEALTGGMGADDESIMFSEILDKEPDADNALQLKESVIFDGIADDLDIEASSDALDFGISETSNIDLDWGFTESDPDLSLDYSDNWFDEVVDNTEGNSEKIASLDDDLSIGYPAEDEVGDRLDDNNAYGFADNLLDSLMDESDEGFDGLSIGLPDLQAFPALSDNQTLGADESDRELESEPDFDFSAFELPAEDSINTARAEIDDFLSGSLDIEEKAPEKKIPTKQVETDN